MVNDVAEAIFEDKKKCVNAMRFGSLTCSWFEALPAELVTVTTETKSPQRRS